MLQKVHVYSNAAMFLLVLPYTCDSDLTIESSVTQLRTDGIC